MSCHGLELCECACAHTCTQLFSELKRFNVTASNSKSAKEEADIKMELQKEREQKGKCWYSDFSQRTLPVSPSPSL